MRLIKHEVEINYEHFVHYYIVLVYKFCQFKIHMHAWMACASTTHLCPGRTNGWLQMNRLSLRNNWLKLETLGEISIILEEYIEEYTSNE